MAVKLTLHRGRQRSGFSARPARAWARGPSWSCWGLIDRGVGDGWAHARACRVLDLADVRAHRWRARLRDTGSWQDGDPGGGAVHGIVVWEARAILELIE